MSGVEELLTFRFYHENEFHLYEDDPDRTIVVRETKIGLKKKILAVRISKLNVTEDKQFIHVANKQVCRGLSMSYHILASQPVKNYIEEQNRHLNVNLERVIETAKYKYHVFDVEEKPPAEQPKPTCGKCLHFKPCSECSINGACSDDHKGSCGIDKNKPCVVSYQHERYVPCDEFKELAVDLDEIRANAKATGAKCCGICLNYDDPERHKVFPERKWMNTCNVLRAEISQISVCQYFK